MTGYWQDGNEYQQNEYKTTDLDFAAFLFACGREIVRTDGRVKKVFIFSNKSRDIEELKTRYLNRQLLVEPTAFWNAIKQMKSLIHQNNTNYS